MGFPDEGGDPIELLFNPTGGDAELLYSNDLGLGSGIILTQAGLPETLFQTSFQNQPFLGLSDTGLVQSVQPLPGALVPEPSSLWIMLVTGGVALLAMRRRRGAKS